LGRRDVVADKALGRGNGCTGGHACDGVTDVLCVPGQGVLKKVNGEEAGDIASSCKTRGTSVPSMAHL
jgi:hypothetical protein